MLVKGREVNVNMQRRQLELIAKVINNIGDVQVTRNTVATMFASALVREGVNPNFNVSRFVSACVEDKK
jgi:hypothetical protein